MIAIYILAALLATALGLKVKAKTRSGQVSTNCSYQCRNLKADDEDNQYGYPGIREGRWPTYKLALNACPGKSESCVVPGDQGGCTSHHQCDMDDETNIYYAN